MAHFPMFVVLKGATVLVVGSEEAARDKIQKLLSFGPHIHRVDILSAGDLTPAPALVILAGGDRKAAARLCMERNIPVNSVDDPENCTFFFPALIQRGEVTVGIGSGGACPAAAAEIRRRVEGALPENLEEIALWLGQITAGLRRGIPEMDRRGAVLRKIAAAAFEKNRPLSESELTDFLM